MDTLSGDANFFKLFLHIFRKGAYSKRNDFAPRGDQIALRVDRSSGGIGLQGHKQEITKIVSRIRCVVKSSVESLPCILNMSQLTIMH